MALIVCKECGKRISDTTEICVHCGAPTSISKSSLEKLNDVQNFGSATVTTTAQNNTPHQKDLSSSNKEHTVSEINKQDTDVDNNKPLEIFQHLNPISQKELEKEFWKANRNARAYRKNFKFFAFLHLVGFFALFAGIFSFIFANTGFLLNSIRNLEFCHLFRVIDHFPYVPIIPTALLLLWFVCLCCASFGLSNEKSAVKYKKRFQKWLLLEKNIKYVPQFVTEKDRRAWEKYEKTIKD